MIDLTKTHKRWLVLNPFYGFNTEEEAQKQALYFIKNHNKKVAVKCIEWDDFEGIKPENIEYEKFLIAVEALDYIRQYGTSTDSNTATKALEKIKQTTPEHHALNDAIWNLEMYNTAKKYNFYRKTNCIFDA